MIAGERDGWDYVWPRDAAAGTIALEAAGLRPEARKAASFLSDIDTERAARFYPDGAPVPGRPAAGDAQGWVAAAVRTLCCRATRTPDSPYEWQERQDYGENATGDLLGNAIAAGAPAAEILSRFETSRGLVREGGSDELDSSAAWAATLFPSRGLRGVVRQTLLALTRESTRYGIPPMEGWTPGEVWTAPDRLVGLGADRAGRATGGGPPARRVAPGGDAPRDPPRARGRSHRRPDLDHAARLVARLRDPRAKGAL